jgi:hypothetical protein
MGDRDNNGIVYSEEKNLLYRHGKPHEPTKEGPLSFVLLESPFTSVSTVSAAGATPLKSLWFLLFT